MTPKLTESSQAVKILRAKFRTGEVTGKEKPKAVWESDPAFQKHRLNNFRTCFNKIKKQLEDEGTFFFVLAFSFHFFSLTFFLRHYD